MKKTLLTFLVASITLNSCTCNKTNSYNLETDLIGQWNILLANGQSTSGADSQPFINFTDSGMVHGNASINHFFGQYTLKGDSIFFDQIGMTSMMGHRTEIESAVTTALNKCATLEILDSTLYAKDMQDNIVLAMEKSKQ